MPEATVTSAQAVAALPTTHTPTHSALGSQAVRTKHAQGGRLMAAATFAMALASAIQALLYLDTFGVNSRTDGFFAAFALYAVAGVFTQSIRVTVAPMLIGDHPRLTPARLGGILALFAGVALLLTWPLAHLTASVLAPGLSPAAREVTAQALPILGGAIALQLIAAGAATLLVIADAYQRVAAAYAIGAAAGVAAFLLLRGPANEEVLGWSMLTMAIVTTAIMLPPALKAVRGQTRGASPAVALRDSVALLWQTVAYLVFYGLWLVTLAAVSSYEAGAATILSYAYLYVSYLVAGTGVAIGQTRVADMAREARSGDAVLRETVPSGFRYALLVCAPAIAGLVLIGARLAHAILPASLSAGDAKLLARDALLLYPWCLAALLVSLLLPAMYALGRVKRINALAAIALVAQIVATLLGEAIAGPDGAVLAAATGGIVLAAGMLLAERRAAPVIAREVAFDAVRFTAAAFGAFGVAAALAALVGRSPAVLVIAGALGCALYVASLLVLAPTQVRVLLTGTVES